MKVVFKDKAKKSKPKIDYGTILLCKGFEKDDDEFDLYRVAYAGTDYGTGYRSDLIHDFEGNERAHFGGSYKTTSELIESLKSSYDIVQVVDAHIVIDKIVGEV